MAEEQLAHRGGLLLVPEQRPEGDAREAPAVRVELLLAFMRRLIQESASGDRVMLAMHAARHDVDATREEVDIFMSAVFSEMR